MGSALVRTGIDAPVNSSRSTTNYGTYSTLGIGVTPTTYYGFLWFKVPAPRGATVSRAILRLYGVGAWGAGAVTVNVQRLSTTWKVSQVTYANRPGVTGAVVNKTQVSNTDATMWEFDVTALVQLMVDGAANYGFRLSSAVGAYHSFWSLDAHDHHPELDVTWSDAPDAPTTLSPAGGRAVSIAKPVLRFDYTDVSGNVDLAAVQVQIDAANDFTAPDWDSGIVLTSDPQLDLTTGSYAGLALAATTYWRVRVQDGAGLWSAWSDPASFTRAAKITASLTNPPLSGVINDFTPPLLWAVTGGAVNQKAWQVLIYLDSDHSKALVDTGRRTGSDNSYTPAGGVLKLYDTNYFLRVLLWDAVARETTPADPTYVELTKVFSITADVGTTGVAALASSQPFDDRPWVTLTWTRASAPDGFNVLRDGKTIANGLLPGDLSTGGTGYSWTDKDSAGNIAHTWEVQAVVNGKGSPRAAVTAKYASAALWITDTTYDKIVAVLNVEAQFDMPETATVYEPVGTDTVVRITQAQRGLQGSINGLVLDFGGAQASDLIAALLWMKVRPTRAYRLTLGQQSINALLGNIVIAPVEFGEDTRAVSLDFWSVDGVQA